MTTSASPGSSFAFRPSWNASRKTANRGGTATSPDVATPWAGYRTSYQNKITLWVHLVNLQILLRSHRIAHMPGHLFSLEDPPWILILTDRARLSVGFGIAVGGPTSSKTVSPHGPGETTPDGSALHIHSLTSLKQFHRNRRARLICGSRVSMHTKLPASPSRFSASLGEVPS